MNPFEVLVSNLQALGFYGFLLPWIFVFAIVYGILYKSELFDQDPRFIGLLSIVIAFLVTGFGAAPLGAVLTKLFGAAMLVIAGILVVLMFAVMAGCDWSFCQDNKFVTAAIVGLGILFVILAFSASYMSFFISSTVIAAILMLVFIAIGVYLIANAD